MPESLQTAAEALLSRLPEPDANRIPDFSKLSYAEVALILKLADDGKPQTYIAQQIGCSQPTVSRVLSEFRETSDLAKKRAHSLALPAVESLERSWRAAEKAGKSGPQEAILKIAGVLGDESRGVQVLVQIGMSETTAINLSPLAFASDALEQGAGSD